MSIVDWIYPRVCAGCGREGRYVCAHCERSLLTPPSICPMCTLPSLGGWTHARCKKRYSLDRLIVTLPYKGVVQNNLKKIKYKSAWDIIETLVDVWGSRVESRLEADVVTCVPMYRQKERERGFNQAEMVAKRLSMLYGIPYATLLTRNRSTPPMYGLTKKERNENVAGAFGLIDDSTTHPRDQRILLADDVWTTGATMRECARELKRVGAREVWGIALAR